MKQCRFLIYVIAFVVIITAALAFYIVSNKEEIIYQYMLYDHIEYNGIAYYQAKDQQSPPSNDGENKQPVYLISRWSKIIYKDMSCAYVYTGYEGEEKEIYLYFDSALYVRGDYQDIKESSK